MRARSSGVGRWRAVGRSFARWVDGLGGFIPLRFLGVDVDIEILAVLLVPNRLVTGRDFRRRRSLLLLV